MTLSVGLNFWKNIEVVGGGGQIEPQSFLGLNGLTIKCIELELHRERRDQEHLNLKLSPSLNEGDDINQSQMKETLIKFSSWQLSYIHTTAVKQAVIFKKMISICSGQIWINVLQRVMRYDPFVEERYNILRISDTCKKSFSYILLKYCYIPHNDNL